MFKLYLDALYSNKDTALSKPAEFKKEELQRHLAEEKSPKKLIVPQSLEELKDISAIHNWQTILNQINIDVLKNLYSELTYELEFDTLKSMNEIGWLLNIQYSLESEIKRREHAK